MRQIILASKSPRRKELLEQIGLTFTMIPACGEEHIHTDDPVEAVKELSMQKAREIGTQQTGDVLIIGADTIVAHEDGSSENRRIHRTPPRCLRCCRAGPTVFLPGSRCCADRMAAVLQ